MLGSQVRRVLEMQRFTTDEIWKSYLNKVKLEHGGGILKEYLRILNLFRTFLGAGRPTAEKAREYLQRFTERSRNTQARYTDIINGVLEWCGEEKVKRVKTPKRQPRYVPEGEYETFFTRISNKRSHRETITRDTLMFQVMDATGMRCHEVATLKVRDLFLDGRYQEEPYLIAHGKGDKDRMIPLALEMAQTLWYLIKGKRSGESVFGLKTKSVINKFYIWKQKAGVLLTAHDLRRHFATDLSDLGVNIRTTQQLMGHEDVTTTERYIAVPPKSARAAIELRGRKRNQKVSLNDESQRSSLSPESTMRVKVDDSLMVDLRKILDPANLIHGLELGIEEIDLAKLPAYELRR